MYVVNKTVGLMTEDFHIGLVAPEIPPNTGNVNRKGANSCGQVPLGEPLGFVLENSKLKRAGLDSHEWARVPVHADLATALAATGSPSKRHFALTTRGARRIDAMSFLPGDVFVFGDRKSTRLNSSH